MLARLHDSSVSLIPFLPMAFCRLANLMLAEQPALRDDEEMMQAYVFLMDFLESFSESMGDMVRASQVLLKELLDAAKISEESFDQYVEDNRAKVSALFRCVCSTRVF